MGFDTPENAWIEFANQHKAEARFYNNQKNVADYFWSVEKQGEFEIRFHWEVEVGDIMKINSMKILSRTDFLFPIKDHLNKDLRIYKKQFLSGISMLFTNNKTKCGDEELDNKYIFVCKPKAAIQSMIPALQKFDQQFTGEDFLIEMEEDHLIIQVNELLKERSSIETFFNLGIALQEKMNKAPVI